MRQRQIIYLKTFVVVFGCCLLVSFNNCSQTGFNAIEMKGTSDLDLGSHDPSAGIALYMKNCASCHGSDISTSDKRNKNAGQITDAIRDQLTMNFLAETLSASDINLIANALSDSLPPEPVTFKRTQPVIGNRTFVATNLTEIFVVDSAPDTFDADIVAIIKKYITGHPEAFGGNCSRYDSSCHDAPCGFGGSQCLGHLQASMTAAPLPSASPVSKGFMMRACEEIVTINKSTQTALSKAKLTPSSEINSSNVLKLMSFIHSERPMDTTSADELVKVAAEARKKGFPVLDQWKFVVLPICYSAAMDLI